MLEEVFGGGCVLFVAPKPPNDGTLGLEGSAPKLNDGFESRLDPAIGFAGWLVAPNEKPDLAGSGLAVAPKLKPIVEEAGFSSGLPKIEPPDGLVDPNANPPLEAGFCVSVGFGAPKENDGAVDVGTGADAPNMDVVGFGVSVFVGAPKLKPLAGFSSVF